MKTKLNPENLVVTSFEVSDRGGVVAMSDISQPTQCLCTGQAGCYPSLYCSLDGGNRQTCAEGCMTNENGLC